MLNIALPLLLAGWHYQQHTSAGDCRSAKHKLPAEISAAPGHSQGFIRCFAGPQVCGQQELVRNANRKRIRPAICSTRWPASGPSPVSATHSVWDAVSNQRLFDLFYLVNEPQHMPRPTAPGVLLYTSIHPQQYADLIRTCWWPYSTCARAWQLQT